MSKVKSIVFLTLAKGVNVMINFLLLPYLARALSYEDYGTYGQILLIMDMTKVLFTSGMGSATYFLLATHSNAHRVISSTFFLSFFLSIFAFILIQGSKGILTLFLKNSDVSHYLTIYSFSLFFSMPSTILSSLLIFYKKVQLSSLFLVFYNLIRVSFLFIAIQFFHSLELVFWGLLVTDLLQFLHLLHPVRSRIRFKQIDPSLMKEAYRQGLYLNMTNILGYLLLYSDSFMVSHFLNVKEYAIYRNGAIEVPFFSTLYISVAQIVLPEVTKRFHRNAYAEIIHLKRKVCQNTLLLTYPLYFFLLFYAQDLFRLYLSEKYAQSGIIFAIFNLTLLLRIYDYLDVLVAAGKTRLIFLVHVLTFGINLFLNYHFIQLEGSKGLPLPQFLHFSFTPSFSLISLPKPFPRPFFPYSLGKQCFLSLRFLSSSYLCSKHFIPSSPILLSSNSPSLVPSTLESFTTFSSNTISLTHKSKRFFSNASHSYASFPDIPQPQSGSTPPLFSEQKERTKEKSIFAQLWPKKKRVHKPNILKK